MGAEKRFKPLRGVLHAKAGENARKASPKSLVSISTRALHKESGEFNPPKRHKKGEKKGETRNRKTETSNDNSTENPN